MYVLELGIDMAIDLLSQVTTTVSITEEYKLMSKMCDGERTAR